MKGPLRLAAALAATLVATRGDAKPPANHIASHGRAAPPLPMLPVVARVRIEAARDHVLVIEDVNLEQDAWTSGDLDLYVAFGAPGVPRAFDARLLAVPQGEYFAALDDAGESIPVERATRRPVSAQVLVGRAQMAGAILHVKEAAFRRALARSELATIRIRTLIDLPQEDARTGHEVVMRLGIGEGAPLAVRRIELASVEAAPWIARAEARLCGADADAYPLSISVTPSTPVPSALEHLPIAPLLAVRHASDDLCVRFWTR